MRFQLFNDNINRNNNNNDGDPQLRHIPIPAQGARARALQGRGVCKAGFTTEFASRMRAYPNGSSIIVSMRIRKDDGRQAERLVLSAFERCFVHRRDIGSEYFEGPVAHMAATLTTIAAQFVCTPDDDPEDDVEAEVDEGDGDTAMDTDSDYDDPDIVPPPPPPKVVSPQPDAMQIVIEFVRPRLTDLAGKRVSSESLYAELVAEAGHRRSCPGLATFTALVRKLFRVKSLGTDLVFPGEDQPVTMVLPLSRPSRQPDISSEKTVASWINTTVQVTGNRKDYVLMTDLKGAFACSGLYVPKQKVSETLRRCLGGLPGVIVKDGDKVPFNGRVKTVYCNIRGVAWRL